MRRNTIIAVFLIVLATGMPAAVRSVVAADIRGVVVTTTLIETAVRDLMGEDVEIVRLLPPGSCPGHFDLDPRQVTALAKADMFIRHDYQAGLDVGVGRAGLDTERIVSLTSLPSFTIPGNYAVMCAELNARLIREWPEREQELNLRLQHIKDQAARSERDIHSRTERIRGRRVLCARYQKDFCEWVGLCVVSSFSVGTDQSAWRLNRAMDMARTAGAEAVVGNRQWGPRHLVALSEATGLPGIMLSNFPESGGEGAYWPFVDSNVDAILEGLHDADY